MVIFHSYVSLPEGRIWRYCMILWDVTKEQPLSFGTQSRLRAIRWRPKNHHMGIHAATQDMDLRSP